MKMFRYIGLVVFPLIFISVGYSQANPPAGLTAVVTPYRIISQPKAVYTDEARTKGVEGAVILKITLLANGEIGTITDVTKKNRNNLKRYGLVDQAIQAARQIKFTPKMVNGKPVSVVVTQKYDFSIY
jgi:TonB family protein